MSIRFLSMSVRLPFRLPSTSAARGVGTDVWSPFSGFAFNSGDVCSAPLHPNFVSLSLLVISLNPFISLVHAASHCC